MRQALLPSLPIDPILPEALRILGSAPCLVLQATPGSGKTTRLPPALLGAPFRGERDEILVLEPRRLAAKFAATRVAEELGETTGETVGYQFRFENRSSPRTRLRFLTEGMLMRRLIRDPRLENVAAVVLDEFHERHLHGDIALGYLRWLQENGRKDLRIIVMSATLDTAGVASFLGDCPVLNLETRQYPVETEYLTGNASRPLELLVRDAVANALEAEEQGDILVFLPGMAEIRRAEASIAPVLKSHGAIATPLHGELSREEQDRAVTKADRRKVILSTNVAETSLTIQGVNVVIDSGLHRQASYSWWSGVPALRTRPTSRASAIQRAGRAGRTGPGRCIRLYSKGDYDGRAPFETPEIRRADISQSILELKRLGIADVSSFPWFEPPAAQAVEASLALLFRLGALGSASPRAPLTELGRRMAELPAHPRIARLLLEASRRGVLEDAATLAALLSEGRLERLDALEGLAQAARDPALIRARTQLLDAVGDKSRPRQATDPERELAFSVLVAFPDRVALKRRSRGQAELVFSEGGSARIDETGVLAHSECFVALEIQERKFQDQARSTTKVSSVCPIQAEWLFDLEPPGIVERDEVRWDEERKQVVASSTLAYGQIILSESAKKAEAGGPVLLKAALGLDPSAAGRGPSPWIEAFSRVADREAIEAVFARVALVAERFPELSVPDPRHSELAPALLGLFQGKASLNELKETDWPAELLAVLAGERFAEIERLAPSAIALPSGRRARVHYKLDQPPWIESRLQDFFGMKQGPAILGGRLFLTIHLLAPNQRAVQVTTDLAGFWQRAYPELRRQLSRRYPKHAWPEDPTRGK